MAKKVAAVQWALIIVTIFLAVSYADKTDNSTSTKIIKENPIVINTVVEHYENPTIGQYELCTKTRDACIKKCSSFDKKCQDACPICPILIDQDVLVQGINDTLYRLPLTTAKINQTNIIRLTNEIRNIIETNLGNITANNQNNIVIHQNKTSITGGKYGLGYTEKGPCCQITEPQRCKRLTSGLRCSHKHRRSCGSHCISRVMRAKRVVRCSELNVDDCSSAVEYIPQPRRPGCHYTSAWPFISCRKTTRSVSTRSSCSRCFSIPYMYVMRGQVSRFCLSCFGHGGIIRQPYYQSHPIHHGAYDQYPMYPSQYRPRTYDSYIDDETTDEFDVSESGNGWELVEHKCRHENGTVIANCTTDAGNEDSFPLNTDLTDSDYISNSDDYEDNGDGVDYDYGEEDIYRRGRRAASRF